jgi:DNA-binding LytR/AlgR family response regulator
LISTVEDINLSFLSYIIFQQEAAMYFALHLKWFPMVNLPAAFPEKTRTRLLVQKGAEYAALRLTDIVLLYVQNRLVFAVDKYGKRYMVNKKLNQLEQELNDRAFFRANRQCIINIQHIRAFRVYERVKLLVDMQLNENKFPVIISQENAAAFRRWIVAAD